MRMRMLDGRWDRRRRRERRGGRGYNCRATAIPPPVGRSPAISREGSI